MDELRKPLVLYTDVGILASRVLTPESVAGMVQNNGVLSLAIHDTCRVEPVPPPPGEAPLPGKKVPFRYVSLAVQEETDVLYLPAARVHAFFHSERMPSMKTFDEVVKVGERTLREKRSKLLTPDTGVQIAEEVDKNLLRGRGVD